MKKLLCLSMAVLGLLAFAKATQAQTIYQDNFDRSGNLSGSSPVTDGSGATWTTSLSSIYTTSTTGGGEVSINSGAYSYQGAYLPVNVTGASLGGGLLDFTLSATVSPGSEGTGAGIALLNDPLGSYAGFNNNSLTSITGQTSYTLWGEAGNYDFSQAVPAGSVLSIVYSASAGTFTYKVGSTVVGTDTGITDAEISALTDVSFGFGGNNEPQTATLESFSLVVAGAAPEPSSVMLMGLGLVGLVFLARRKHLAKV